MVRTVPRPRGRTVVLVVLVVLGLCVGCTDDASSPVAGAAPTAEDLASIGPDGRPHFTRIAELGQLATSITPVPDGSALLASTRTGLVYRLDLVAVDGRRVPTLDPAPVLDLTGTTGTEVEQGLLGLAVSADSSTLYTYSTDLDAGLVLQSFPYVGDGPIDPERGRAVMSVPHPHWGHNGGALALTEQGDLMVTVAGLEAWPRAGARPVDPVAMQDTRELGVLQVPADRLAPDAPPYQPTPADLVARGLRNPWSLSIDAATGALWIGDVGENAREEVDRIDDPTPGRPVDFGWPAFEGTETFVDGALDASAARSPVFERSHGEQVCAVVGGAVYRGAAVPRLEARYVYGDMCSDELRSIDAGAPPADDRAVASVPERPISMGMDAAGEMYLLGEAGGVYRLDPGGWSPADANRRADPVATTTTVQPVPPEACGVVDGLMSVNSLDGATPDELRAAYLDVRARFGPALEQLGPDGQLLLRSTDRFIAAGEMAGWDLSDPTFLQVQTDSRAGTGDFVGLPEAISRLFERVNAGCS